MKLIISYLVLFQIVALLSTCIIVICFLPFYLIMRKQKQILKRKQIIYVLFLSELITQCVIIPLCIYWFQDINNQFIIYSIPALSFISCLLKYKVARKLLMDTISDTLHEDTNQHIYK